MMRAALLVLALVAAAPVLADSSMPPAHYAYTQLEDPAQEAKARALMDELRCVVCQGQSIADSDAELAGDMRAMVRERVKAGEDPKAIRAWMIERYGSWVTYDPPLDSMTWPLWVAPVVFLLAGIWLARGRLRRHR